MKKSSLCGLLCLSVLLTGCAASSAYGSNTAVTKPNNILAASAAAETKSTISTTAVSSPPQTDSSADSNASVSQSAPYAPGSDYVYEKRAVPKPAPENEIIKIPDDFFITNINDIYINAEDYLGKTIRYQGVYAEEQIPELNRTLRYVYRYGPGCCGNDGNVGFEVVYDGDKYPNPDDWVEVTGILESYTEHGADFLRLQVCRIDVLPERGEEFVVR